MGHDFERQVKLWHFFVVSRWTVLAHEVGESCPHCEAINMDLKYIILQFWLCYITGALLRGSFLRCASFTFWFCACKLLIRLWLFNNYSALIIRIFSYETKNFFIFIIYRTKTWKVSKFLHSLKLLILGQKKNEISFFDFLLLIQFP